MKQYIIAILAASLIWTGCKKDPYDGVSSEERAIETFTLDKGQIGVAQITRTPDATSLIVYVKKGTDLSAVKPRIVTSYKSTVAPASGEQVNFASGGNKLTYTVTAESGSKRSWEVEVREYIFDFDGTWKVSAVGLDHYVGEGEGWGWGNHNDLLKRFFPNAAFEEDNTLKLELAVAEGAKLSGTYVYSAGADGKYAGDYIHAATGTNFNYKFSKLSQATGSWEMDLASMLVTFDKGTPKQAVSQAIVWQNAGKTSFNLPFSPGAQDIDWGSGNGDKMSIGSAKSFWYTFVKQ